LKLIAPLLALTLAVSVSAQTSSTTSAAKSDASAIKITAAKPAAGKSTIPVVHGLKKSLYSLSYIDTVIGTGPLAVPSVLGATQDASKIQWYTVHYTGWLAKDGTKFDSSYDHPGGSPIVFPYGAHRVIPGWDTGFEGMHVGGKRRLFIPYQLAYGIAGKPPVIPAKADLIFDVELVGISDKPPAPPAMPTATKPSAAPASAPAAAKPAVPAATAPAAAPAPAAAAKPAPVATPAPATAPATK
jgi:peptidylprolyl isomerase